MSLLVLSLCLTQAPTVDWPALVQKPYAHLPAADLGLRPLLETSAGKKPASKADFAALSNDPRSGS